VSVVKYFPNTLEFVPEEAPAANPEPNPTLDVLRLRLQQQQILADFGVVALKGASFVELLDQATRCVAEGLEADFAKVLKYLPEQNRFLVCAGVGWGPGVVGHATVGADTASPAGYALKTGKAVISNHLNIEDRFRTPELLVEYGIRRAMNVILGEDNAPFGVLEVDSRSEVEFSHGDIVFLRGVANILGMAIERQRIQANLVKALEREKMLTKEVNHRVNNSLQIVASVLRLQSSVVESEDGRHALMEAGSRIAAVARAHQRLYTGDQIEALDLGAYLRQVCADIGSSMPSCDIDVSAGEGVVVSTDRAVPAILIVNELITNAVKYAYSGRRGKIWVTLFRSSDLSVAISVRDEGVGLPPQFDQKEWGLGMRLVNSLVQQLRGELQTVRKGPGAEFVLTVPLHT
jgi:two-component sensor histidine kinase